MLTESIAKFLKLDNLVANLTGYIETKVELVKIEAKEEIAHGLSKALVYILMALAGSTFVLFFSIAIAFQISKSLGEFAGFSIVAGFYLLAGVILFISRKPLQITFEKHVSAKLKKKKK